jgi:diketogulonate reductase-like aldo/keto reductase
MHTFRSSTDRMYRFRTHTPPQKNNPIQFHWNDYSDSGYITALHHLQDLQREGLISALGLCNFDAIRMDEICTTLGPRSIVSNQIQVCVGLCAFG